MLVATDVAARGLDIPQIDLVVQCEPPKDVDDYIHRCGSLEQGILQWVQGQSPCVDWGSALLMSRV